jgi:hypothetical protein
MSTSDNVPFSEFIAPDRNAQKMLGEFFNWLKDDKGLTPQDASELAHAADRYLRDFVVDIMAIQPEETSAKLVRMYLGNWYIVNTLTPTLKEIELIARALELLHAHAAITGKITAECATEASATAKDPTPFKERLEQFWDLTPEGIDSWREVDDYRKPINESIH